MYFQFFKTVNQRRHTGYEVCFDYHTAHRIQMCKLWSQELYRMWSKMSPLSNTTQSTITNVYTGLQINAFSNFHISKKKRQKSNKWKWCSIIWQCGSWYVMSYQAAKLKFQRQYLFTVRLSFLQLSGDSSFLLFNWHAEAAPSATRWTVHTQAICCKFVPDTKSLWTSPVRYIKS